MLRVSLREMWREGCADDLFFLDAEMLIRGRYRNSFVFRPLPREWAVGGSVKGDVVMKDSDDEERAKREKKERLEQFKREADVGFGTGMLGYEIWVGELK